MHHVIVMPAIVFAAQDTQEVRNGVTMVAITLIVFVYKAAAAQIAQQLVGRPVQRVMKAQLQAQLVPIRFAPRQLHIDVQQIITAIQQLVVLVVQYVHLWAQPVDLPLVLVQQRLLVDAGFPMVLQ
jgi:hypothetical protein